MQNKSASINKVVLFIVFICAAIMTSLFIFHARHKTTQINLSTGNGMLFPVAREIKPFQLYSTNQQKFSQQDLLNHWTLLFFGFTHCSTVCPNTLGMLNKAYTTLHQRYSNLQVVVISLDPARDSLESLAKYTQAFNADFIGATGKIQEIRKLQSQLGIFSARDPETAGANYQLQHTSSILLINPQGKWVGIFKYGMNPTEFVNAMDESLRALR